MAAVGIAAALFRRATIPTRPWVQEVERFTGAQGHRNAILETAGALRFE